VGRSDCELPPVRISVSACGLEASPQKYRRNCSTSRGNATGYAEQLKANQPVPLIDSALAGLQVLLDGRAPPPHIAANGFQARWSNVDLDLGSRTTAVIQRPTS